MHCMLVLYLFDEPERIHVLHAKPKPGVLKRLTTDNHVSVITSPIL